MSFAERPPRWERFTSAVARALDYAFGCRHKRLSRVFTIASRTYKVCCDCGADFDYSLKKMEMEHRPAMNPLLELLRTRHT